MLVKLTGSSNYSKEWKKFALAFSSIPVHKNRHDDEKVRDID
jgi:hypothetical protein